ncbi:MAG: Chromosomal replication initiator protein DnaA [Elusimicrobia bacterium ADurb.Bin231]|nr:MAG: Chromosomal replication initiator protein DnaA [Elusimicrobia bacterium ADurb.Bin231]
MNENPQELWEKCLEVIKNEIPESTFDLWVKPAKPIKVENGKLIIEVPNKFFISWFKEHINDKVEKFLSQNTNNEIVMAEYNASQNIDTILNPANQTTAAPLPIQIPKEESIFLKTQFNPKYTFEKFIVGNSNKFAHAASKAVSEEPGKAYNPLFVYGDVGLGKTHLLHAIGHNLRTKFPDMKILYITCEKFANEMIDSITRGTMPSFHNKYRSLDVLLIDDIQFIGKGEQTQEVFHHTFNALYDAGKQVVLSADSAPKEIEKLQDRLKSRFEWGLVADIQPPDLETRIAILKNKVVDEQIHVPEDVILYIASHIKANIRELEGALIRIVAHASLTGSQITIDKTSEILKTIITPESSDKPITLELIQQLVATNFNLEIRDLKSKKRTNAIAIPRQIAMYLTREFTELSTIEIGDAFGGRDHTTVLYAYETIKKKTSKDQQLALKVDKIIQELKAGR